MFHAPTLETQTEDFDYVRPQDALLRAQNQQLYAIRAQINKTIQKPQIARPVTALAPSASPVSLLTKRRVETLKAVDYTINVNRTQKREIEGEKLSLEFGEDPVAYFSKRKDGRGHRFIYLNFADNRDDVTFSPYHLVKVPFAEIAEEHFTMSAGGVTHIYPDGMTENISLDQWTKEASDFEALRKLKVFKFFFYWKPLRIWRLFVRRQRYTQIREQILEQSMYSNQSFMRVVMDLFQSSCSDVLTKYLLCFIPQSRYTMKEFKATQEKNRDLINDAFSAYLDNVVAYVLELDADIRDPQRLVVKNTDIRDGRKVGSKLGDVIQLEARRAAERQRRKQQVQFEMSHFAGFVRMVDYGILETLVQTCLECWRTTDKYVSGEMASIFEVSISFSDEGEMMFDPSFEELIKAVLQSLHDAKKTVATLPRLLMSSAIRPHMREVIPNLNDVFETGPQFDAFFRTNVQFSTIRKHIVEVLTANFKEAEAQSQQYKQYFHIYQIGKYWHAEDYLKERGGAHFAYDVTATFSGKSIDDQNIVYDPSKEKVVDFNQIKEDVAKFRQDQTAMTRFRACTISGALYTDSRNLRATLTPIPGQTLTSMQNMLKGLAKQKMNFLCEIFKIAHARLRTEPKSLETYVDFCYFIKRTEEAIPFLAAEMDFVDSMLHLLDELAFPAEDVKQAFGPIREVYEHFNKGLSMASTTKENIGDTFAIKLEQIINDIERKLKKYQTKLRTFPTTLVDIDIEYLLTVSEQSKAKIEALAPQIQELILCQEILGKKINMFTSFGTVTQDAQYQKRFYQAVEKWLRIDREIQTVPMVNIDMPAFKEEVLALESDLNAMQTSTENPLLDEIKKKVEVVAPYLEPLIQLSSAQMHLHHWNQLFEDCGQRNAYYTQIRIKELISLGILQESDKIAMVTSTSQGESQLETEFRDITKHWKEMEIPIISRSEDNIFIGDISPVLADIVDTQITVNRMLSVPYCQGIRESVLALSKKIEGYAAILEAWSTFQKNWVVLSPVFAIDGIKKVIPTSANRFGMVKRKWANLVKHAASNASLEYISTFPGLLEMLKENNVTVEQLLVSLHKFLEMKRSVIPRLYFVSDAELVTMVSTCDFRVLSSHISKIFMNITGLEAKVQDLMEERSINLAPNFERIKVHGLIGSSGDTLPFAKPVQCVGAIEVWIKQIFESMTVAMKDAIPAALASYKKMKIWPWLESISMNIGILCLYIIFCGEIQECFNNLENNIRSFLMYGENIKKKIEELSAQSSFHLKPVQLAKLSSSLVLLNFQLHLTRKLGERTHDYSQSYGWKYSWKIGYDSQNSTVRVEMGDLCYEHGYEYYGMVKPFICTGDSHRTLKSVAHSLIQTQFMMMVGGEGIGQSHMLEYLAVLFGKPVFTSSAYPCCTKVDITKILTAAIRSDGWLVLRDINNYTRDQLCYLYDTFQKIENLTKQGIKTMKLDDVNVTLQNSSRFILLSTPEFVESVEMPLQLKSLLKPVGFAAPDLVGIAEINLMGHNFSSWKQTGRKIVNSIQEIHDTIGYLGRKSALRQLFILIEASYRSLDEICCSEETRSLEYKADPVRCEEFVICLSIFKMYAPVIRKAHQQVLLQILFANFRVADSLEAFQQMMLNPQVLDFAKKEEELRTTCKDEIESHYPTLPTEYIVPKVVDLWNMLNNYPVVVISGGAKSGKTSIMDILVSVSPKVGMNPIRVLDLYHESDTPEVVFGYGSGYGEPKYAQIHSFCTELMSSGEFTGVLRFNGPITPRFVTWMKEVFRNDSFKLSTFDSYPVGSKLRVIIETDDISNLTPEMLACFAILPMSNVVASHESTTEYGSHGISDPVFLFARLSRRLFSMFPASSVEIIKSSFVELAPKIVTQVYGLKNELFSDHSTHNMKEGELVLVDHLTTHALLFSALYMKEYGCDMTSEVSIRHFLLFGLFTVFTSILDHASSTMLDTWIRSNYNIEVPQDWAEFQVPEHFWDLFPRPCLQAMHYMNGILIPLDLESLRQSPIIRKTDHVMSPSSVAVYTTPCLQIMFEAKILVKYNENMLLYGPSGCGKTSFLSFLFNNEPRVTPIYIPVSPLSTASSLFRFIRKHTDVTKKEYILSTNPKAYALIFDNVEPCCTEAIEFIRMLTTASCVPSISTSDPKMLEFVQLRNYFIIVTSRTLKGFSSRFVSQFTPLRMNAPTPSTNKHIFMRISEVFEMNAEFCEHVITLYESLKPDFSIMRLLDCLCHLEYRACKTDRDTELMMKAVMLELDLYLLHNQNDPDFRTIFISKFRNAFPGPLGDVAIGDFENQNLLYVPDISYNVSKRILTANITVQQKHLLHEELNYNYVAFNRRLGEKAVLRFTGSVMKTYVLLERALTFPGASVMLKGDTGLGKRSLCMFISSMKDFDFIDISNTGAKSQPEAMKVIAGIMEKASVSQKPIVVYLRAAEETREITELVLSLIRCFDFGPYFTESEVDTLYAKMAKTVPSIDTGGIIGRFTEAMNGLQMVIRFVISVNDAYPEQNCPTSYLIKFAAGHRHWERMAQDMLESGGINNSMLVSNLKKIHTAIVPKYCKTSSNDFIDMVGTFLLYLQQDENDIMTVNKNSQYATSFIAKLVALEDQLKEKLADLAPKVEELQKKSNELGSAYQEKSEAILVRSDKWEREKRQFEEEMAAMKQRMKEEQDRYGDDLLKLSQSKSVIERLNSMDLRPLVSMAYNMPKQMKKVIKVYCLFLGLKPSYQQVGLELFTRDNFLSIILGIDYQNVTPVTVEKVRRLFAGFEFSSEALKKISPVAEQLYQYIYCLFLHCRRADDLNKERIKLERKQNEYEKRTRESELEIKSLAELQETLKDEKREIEAIESSRRDLSGKKEVVELRLQHAQEILKGLDEFNKLLDASMKSFDEQKEMSMGNMVLFAVYLTYCGRMRKEHVRECLQIVRNELQASGFSVTKEDPDIYVAYKVSIADQSEKSLKIDKFLSQDTENEIQRLKCSLRTPLILDYDGYTTSYLKDSIKRKVLEVSLLDYKFDTIITEAMANGKTVIVYDVDFLNRTLEEILPLELMPDDQAIHSSVSVAGISIIRNPKFKMFLVSSLRDPNQIPDELRVRTSVFVCSENPTMVFKLMTMFKNKFAPSITYETSSAQRNETIIERVRMKRDLIDLMAEIENEWELDEAYDILEDSELIDDFLRIKERYLQNIQIQCEQSTPTPVEFSRFLPSVNWITTFWNALVRYVPRVETCKHFLLEDYLQVIQGQIDQMNDDLEDKEIQKLLMEASLKHVLPSLTTRQGMFVLFITSFLLNCEEKNFSVDTLTAIVDHCYSEMSNICDFSTSDILTGDPINQMKFANISNLFFFMYRSISEVFGDFFEKYFPSFRSENLIPESEGHPVIIRTSRENYPVPMLLNHISTHSVNDQFVALSVTNDEKHLKSIADLAKSLANKIVFVHYTTPSRASAQAVGNLINWSSKSGHAFKLVIFAETLDMLPCSALTCPCYTIDGFPSLRAQMEQISNQYQALMRSSVNAPAIRKLSYGASLLVSTLNYRSCFSPVGYCQPCRFPDAVIRELLGYVKDLIELRLKEVPVKNFSQIIDQLSITPLVSDTFDCERVRCQIMNMIRPDIVKKDYVFTPKDPIWSMPVDVFKYDHLPTFGFGDILFMDDTVSVLLRKWNLSRYFVAPLAHMHVEPPFEDFDQAQKMAGNALVTMPTVIFAPDQSKFNSPTSVYLLSEIESFNNAISAARRDLTEQDVDVVLAIGSDKAPKKWRETFDFAESSSFTRFLSHVNDRAFLLKVWLKGSVIPSPTDARLLTNVKGIFDSFLIEEALKRCKPASELDYRFILCADKTPFRTNGFILSNCWLVGVGHANQKLTTATTPFTRIAQLVCEVVDRSQSENLIKIPIFKKLPCSSISGPFNRIDGEVDNFVRHAYIQSDIPQSSCTSNGACIVCQLAEYFA